MAWYRCGGGGLPAGLQSDMDTVLNKKFSTSTTYPPTDWPGTVNLMGPLPEKTASGAISNITDGADGVPLKNWLVTLPASLDGYTEVNGMKAGKNFIDFPDNLTTGMSGGITFSKTSNGGISFSGTATGTFAYITPKFDFKIPSGKQFTLSRDTAFSFRHCVQLTFSDNTTASVVIDANNTSVTYTTAKDVIAVRLIMSQLTAQTAYSGTVYIQIEFNSSATPFEAFFSTQYTASLGRTIYGGTADIVTGEGSNGSILIDLSELTWNMDNDTRFRSRQTDYTGASGWSGNWQNTVSNRFVCENPATAFTNRSDYSFANIPQNYYNFDIKVPTGIFADANAFKAWLANIDGNGTHAVVVIDRLNAETFTFTPITPTPETALGVNNFWADEGDSDVTYRADISLALQAINGGRGLMMMRPTEPEETKETEETEGLEDELNR